MSNNSDKNQAFNTLEFHVNDWIDARGSKTKAIKLSDYDGKFKVLFCFQSWCPGCHKKGFPDLKQMVNDLIAKDDIVFLAVQTVFEGYHANTYEKMVETQKQYDLKIPFGHDAGDDGKSISNIMVNYQTGGTPWFIFIDKNNKVVFSDFRLNPEAANSFLKEL